LFVIYQYSDHRFFPGMRRMLFSILSLLAVILITQPAKAQLFGQNKPRYRTFHFKVLETPHFDIHYYSTNKDVIGRMANWSEEWYDNHRQIFRDSFTTPNPIILYNSHAEFQQTNAVYGDISIGTGGVTEGFKNRVVLPYSMINQQTQQVLGHELVHAFQYHRIINGDSTSLESLSNLPLWMVEGMAEYVSLGRVDTYTAMWMRDAVINNDVPNVKKLSTYKYFPYRYGQAFWAFFSGTYGDNMIEPLFTNTAKYGIDIALGITLHTTQDQLGSEFTESLRTYYLPFLGDMKENNVGKKIISDENAGQLNVSPVISPDGKYVIFLSDKNLYSTDLYLADARTGKIVRMINSFLRNGSVDDFSFLESAGAWSPDSKQFVFVAYIKGRNILLVKDPKRGKTKEKIKIAGMDGIAHPSWSPDGKEIAFSGMKEGQTDLYIYNLKNKKTRQLTNDLFSEVYPDYSPDGHYLIFSSDRKTYDQKKVNGKWNLHLSRLNLADNAIEDYQDIFPGADCINPCYDPQGKVYFVSDRDGFRNLYRYDLNDELLQMTDLKTGISGIGRYSPAISVSKNVDRIAFTHYFKSGYDIYETKSDKFLFQPVDPLDVHFEAGTLPIILDKNHQIVTRNIDNLKDQTFVDTNEYKSLPYRGKFKLDYVDGGGFGVGVGGFGGRTSLGGGVSMVYSDILGNNQLYTTVALNGEIYDIGAFAQYLNQKSHLAWGFAVSHIPNRSGFYGVPYQDTLSGTGPVIIQEENTLRVFEDQIVGILQYPISKYLRLEGNLGFNYRYFRLDQRDLYYNEFGQYLGASNRHRVPIKNDIEIGGVSLRQTSYYNTNIALVGDNSQFGLASPVNGYRYRFDFSNYFGGYEFQTATIDIRIYEYKKPVTFAFRILHYATLGRDSRSFYPILIGDNGLVHGYDYSSLRDYQDNNNIYPNQLQGSKIFLSGFEVRLPFTGPERLALLKSNSMFTELAWFLDGGVAFNDYEDLGHKLGPGFNPIPVYSTGFSLRVNLFGALVVEPYYVFPLLKNSHPRFGVFLVPGW
jgi:Tol biopolymer transport system component